MVNGALIKVSVYPLSENRQTKLPLPFLWTVPYKLYCCVLCASLTVLGSSKSDNIYNDDPPPDNEAYLNEYEEQEVDYEGQVGDYMEAVQEAIAVNDIAETFVMLVSQTKWWQWV